MFRCEGTVGPPCFVQRGDTVLLEVDWANPGVANMTQSTVGGYRYTAIDNRYIDNHVQVWVTWIEMPWVGMETEACPFLDGGNGCQPDAAVSDIYISTYYCCYLFTCNVSGEKQQVRISHLHPGDVSNR